MIDVNKITSVLAKLQDPQLQQYAQMHKNDPYIMALAMSESNRRKAVRSAGQGVQGMQEQPKVVDSEIAQMAAVDPMGNVTGYAGGGYLPEDQGIGRLNAGNMNFAGGGIIAFADGGDVERYQSGGITDRYRQESMEMGMGTRMQYSPEVQAYAQAQEQASKASYADRERAQMLQGPYSRTAAPMAAAQPTQSPAVVPNYSPDNLSGLDRRLMAGSQPSIASFKTPLAPKASDAAPKAVTGRTAPAAGRGTGAATSLPGLPGQTDLTDLRQRIADKQDFKDPAAAGLLELEARERANAAAEKTAIERDAERFKDAYKGREARLAEREADIGKQKDSNMGLAFLNAGLAIMSTPGGLATAIGKGAQVGTAQFAAGLDKIRSAQERLGEARDRLDDLKLNREESTAKEIRAAERNYRDVSVNAQKRTIDGIRMAADVNEKRATDIYSKTVDMTKTMYEQQQANARSAAGIAAQRDTPDRLVFDQLVRDNKGDAVKAAEALQKMKAEKFNMYEAYSKYLTGFAGKETMTPPMDFDQFASKFTVPTTKTPGKGATVLTQP